MLKDIQVTIIMCPGSLSPWCPPGELPYVMAQGTTHTSPKWRWRPTTLEVRGSLLLYPIIPNSQRPLCYREKWHECHLSVAGMSRPCRHLKTVTACSSHYLIPPVCTPHSPPMYIQKVSFLQYWAWGPGLHLHRSRHRWGSDSDPISLRTNELKDSVSTCPKPNIKQWHEDGTIKIDTLTQKGEQGWEVDRNNLSVAILKYSLMSFQFCY